MAHIDSALIELLLEGSEGADLDFKEKPYPRTTDDEKSELIKDVLAMANAWWPPGDRYILIGVRERPGQRAEVIGLKPNEHVPEHTLQQMVNAKLNTEVRFAYVTATVEGKSIGIIRIPREQTRPIYREKDFGKIHANEVFVRRGSHTHTATLEDVKRMVRAEAVAIAEVNVEVSLVAARSRNQIDAERPLRSTVLRQPRKPTPEEEEEARKFFERLERTSGVAAVKAASGSKLIEAAMGIAAFKTQIELGPFGYSKPSPEKVFEYKRDAALLTAVELSVKNTGRVLATGIRIECVITGHPSLRVPNEYPERPRGENFVVPRFGSASSDIEVEAHEDSWEVEAPIGDVQPKATRRSDTFWIGASEACTVRIAGLVFGDNIPDPIPFELDAPLHVDEKLVMEHELDVTEEELEQEADA